MYRLKLTQADRRAFDMTGDRYHCGDAMARILSSCLSDDDAWDDAGTLTFSVPEHKAWQIRELHEQDCEGGHSGWAMFGPSLACKMQEFVDSIV
jgi:hypothetical protein